MYRFALLMALLVLLFVPLTAQADEWGHGEDCWWCNQENFSLDDDATVWKYLMAEVTVLNADMQQKIYVLDAPNGNRIKTGQYEGFLYGTTVGVHVLKIEGDWALIEGYDMSNQFLRGYVKSSLLKKVTPYATYGMVVDKQTQRLHLYKDGVKLTELLVSTGLPEEGKAYNETAAGEYLIGSWSGGFWSGNMFCDMGLRFNGGDLLHLVPCLINADGSRNYAPFEPLLGTRASHGCIRVQRRPSAEGISMQWLWDNLKRNTKLLIWDDADRAMLYPDDDLELYYNPDNGEYYHADQYCHGVKDRHLPLTAFHYVQLRDEPFSKLTPCTACIPPMKPQEIDKHNLALGLQIPSSGAGVTSPSPSEASGEMKGPTAVLVEPSGNAEPEEDGWAVATAEDEWEALLASSIHTFSAPIPVDSPDAPEALRVPSGD